jgi:hypothetical protein
VYIVHQLNWSQSLMQRPFGWLHAPVIFFAVRFAAIAGDSETAAAETATINRTFRINFVVMLTSSLD